MDVTPPDLPPREPEPDPNDVGPARKTLRVLAALAIPPVLAGGAGMMAMLMMAFAADAGKGDHDLRDRMFVGVLIAIGSFALCAIPATFAVVAPPSRRTLWWRVCWTIAILSVLGTIACLAVYFSAVMEK